MNAIPRSLSGCLCSDPSRMRLSPARSKAAVGANSLSPHLTSTNTSLRRLNHTRIQNNLHREGVTVSLGFFDDILIQADALQHPSRYLLKKLPEYLEKSEAWRWKSPPSWFRYDEAESVWVWEYLPEGEEETHDLFMDPGEQIRCGM